FSEGADWEIKVIYYNRPELESTTGYANMFRIPTQFNGDRLATMEAIYLSGGNAGSHSWTSFKEFNQDFYPVYDSYDSDAIRISREFFNSIREGEDIKLTMHFWSGEKVDYIINKDGSAVEGRVLD
ncbi:MAG: cellulase, partial [bacterium]